MKKILESKEGISFILAMILLIVIAVVASSLPHLNHDSTETKLENLENFVPSQTDNYYNLTSNTTIHIGLVNLIEDSSEGTTISHVYSRIKTPDTTTYTLYMITFEFT